MATWIKICGVTNEKDANLAARLGADAIGFVQHRASPRFCSPDRARAIIRTLPNHLTTVGVWFDENADVVFETARSVGFECVQTYDQVAAGALIDGGLNVLPAICGEDHRASRDIWLGLYRSWPGRFIVDRSRSSTGASMSTPVETCDATPSFVADNRMILAGGLNHGNAREALEAHRPAGVDVASGVESSPGRKSLEELVRFIEEVRQWDAMVSSEVSADSLSPRR